jgi:hypothetical protein
MEVGIEFPTGMLGEACIDQTTGGFMPNLALVTAAQGGVLLEIIERRANSTFMCGKDALIA